MKKWYLSTWFIALLFAFWFFVIPLIVGIFLLIMQSKEQRKLNKEWQQSGFGDLISIQQEKEKLEKEIERLNTDRSNLITQKEQLNSELEEKKNRIIILDDEILYQDFGFYDPKYEFETSEEYKEALETIRQKQKEMVKMKIATIHFEDWVVEGSKSKGRQMVNNNLKSTIRAFNNECDVAISKVKFNNVESIIKRIEKAYNISNKMNKQNRIEIKPEYYDLKIEELFLAYEYEKKKEEEKQEQRQIREQIREEQKVLQEIKRMKEKIEKEEKHFEQAIIDLKEKLETSSEKAKIEIEDKIKELEEQLDQVKKNKEDVENRENNTRAGYVYVISNIGSFGENIYKIGMTRRLEPLDRIKELSDASVPFIFDVHAMIFSEDAPNLESALHKAFSHKRVNMVNERKEFFNVSLGEISDVVKKNHNKTIEFTKLAEASEYRQTQQLLKTQKAS